ncbi:MAG: DUF932 domain-containing protein, partial [Flavobacteriales bacterium]
MNELTQHLNWEVKTDKIILPGNKETNRFVLTRSDNGDILSVRSDRYHPVYNRDLEHLRKRITDRSGFRFKGYQEFQKGKKILAFFENPAQNISICDQKVKDYLIIGNSHDTTSKLFVGTSNYMIRCENQFSEKIRSFERRHDRPFNIKELNIEVILNNYESGRRKLYHRMERLQQRRADQETIRELVRQLLGTMDYSDRLELPNRELKPNEQTLQMLD